MGRVTGCAVFAGVLFFLFSCDASISVHTRTKSKVDPRCVSAKTEYGRYRDTTSNVATCGFAETIQSSTESLQQQLMDVEDSTGGLIREQQGKIEALQGDVASLQGNDSALFPLYVDIGIFQVRLCEIYTTSEAQEWARLAFGDENPDVHWVHVPCENNCPQLFLKLVPGCYRPNDPFPPSFMTPMFGCFEFNVLSPCTREVFITNRGYTRNIDRSTELVVVVPPIPSEEDVPQSMRNMTERLARAMDGQ